MKLKSQNRSNVVWGYILLGCILVSVFATLNSPGARLKSGFREPPLAPLTEHADPVRDLADAKATGDDRFRAVADVASPAHDRHVPGVTEHQAYIILYSHNYRLLEVNERGDAAAKKKMHEIAIAYAAKYNALLHKSNEAALGSTPRSP